MDFSAKIAKQYRQPTGGLGKLIARFICYKNKNVNEWILDMLKLQREDNILEIGFGMGLAIKAAAGIVTEGKVKGVDISPLMVNKAMKICKNEINKGRVELNQGDVFQQNFSSDSFTKVYAINVIYFWDSIERNLEEIYRILKPGGTFVTYITDKSDLEKLSFTQTGVFKLYSTDEIIKYLTEKNFEGISVKTKDVNRYEKGICIIANKK